MDYKTTLSKHRKKSHNQKKRSLTLTAVVGLKTEKPFWLELSTALPLYDLVAQSYS